MSEKALKTLTFSVFRAFIVEHQNSTFCIVVELLLNSNFTLDDLKELRREQIVLVNFGHYPIITVLNRYYLIHFAVFHSYKVFADIAHLYRLF